MRDRGALRLPSSGRANRPRARLVAGQERVFPRKMRHQESTDVFRLLRLLAGRATSASLRRNQRELILALFNSDHDRVDAFSAEQPR